MGTEVHVKACWAKAALQRLCGCGAACQHLESWIRSVEQCQTCPLSAPCGWEGALIKRCSMHHVSCTLVHAGVITDWDPQCKASDQWIQQMGVDSLPGQCSSCSCFRMMLFPELWACL